MSDTKYLVAARRYRPQLFEEVVAQKHVTATLKNAIKKDRLAHAYLFSGPRGVGKTTIARILAKAINCEVPLEDRPEAEPCEKCASCVSLNEGRSLNIIEIDAASNNKVEDVRELRDTVRIPPQGARKKVYIVDEVHMLSNAAFNAFLKTLEEPPPYALFIFATTEPRKVIPTILSRCQRFDFKRIPVDEIVSRLKEIASHESIKIDDASLMLIAQKGDGALRDALSVFDQAVSLCGTDIKYANLAQALRVVDQELFFTGSNHIVAGDTSGMLDLVDSIVSEGYDLQEFLGGFAEHVRNLLVAVTTGEAKLIEATAAMQKRYLKEGKQFNEQQLLRILAILGNTEDAITRSPRPRLAIELGLLKIATSMNAVDLRSAITRLDQLEKKVKSAMAAPARTVAEQPSLNVVSAPSPATTRPADEIVVTPPKKKERPSPAKKTAPEPEIQEAEAQVTAPVKPTATPKKHSTPKPSAAKPSAGEPAPATTETSESSPAPATSSPATNSPGLFGKPALKKRRTSPENQATEKNSMEGSLALATVPEQVPIPESIESIWLKYVSTVKSIRIHVGSLLQHCAPINIRKDVVVLAVPDEFHRRLLDNQQEFLIKHLNEASDTKYRKLEFSIRDIAPVEGAETKSNDFDPYEYMKKKRQESPVVKAIFEDFGGELVW